MSEEQIACWLSECNCFINLGTEGFGLWPLQACAVGRPVISPVFGGVADYLRNGLTVSHYLVPAEDSWKGLGLWAQADSDAVIAAMRYAANPDNREAISWIGHKAYWNTRHLTWENSIKTLHKVLTAIGCINFATYKPKKKSRCVVQLGRHGDIINILPAIKRMAQESGEKVPVVVAKEYAPTLDGCSYVEPVVWDEHFSKLNEAIAFTRERFDEVIVTQVYGEQYAFVPSLVGCKNFNRDSWGKLGNEIVEHFDKPSGLGNAIFDQRDFEREAAVVDRWISKDKPNVLINLCGASTPFDRQWEFISKLRAMLPGVHLCDIGVGKLERIYDLLGLYDRACCLITSDTATLHLARDSSIPVIALCGEGWHGSEPVGNIVMKIVGYENAWKQLNQIVSLADACAKEWKPHPRLIFLRQDWNPSAATSFREAGAAVTLRDAGIEMAYYKARDFKNARFVGDTCDAPSIKQVIDWAFIGRLMDIIVFANNDICILPITPLEIRKGINRYGCFYSNRIDVDEVVLPLTERPAGEVYPGMDLFAFTYDWWVKHRDMIPDLFMSFEGWDFICGALMKRSGFVPGEPCVVHQKHEESNWKFQNDRPAQKHNRGQCIAWAKRHGFEQYLIDGGRGDFLFKTL